MILVDFSAIAIGNVVSSGAALEQSVIRHMILNSIKMYRKKFGAKYGEIVICCDKGNWRKRVFSNYKIRRSIGRDESNIDWDKAFELINTVLEEIREHFPYKVLDIQGCEGDDIIGVMAEYTNEFGNYEEIMIVSGDKDFAQLQKFPNIAQFSTVTKKFIREKDPHKFLFQHICKGDGSDDVPNIMSPDDIFLQEGVRQNVMSQKKIDEWYKHPDLRKAMGEDTYRNYIRNKKMIDLSETPQELKDAVINSFENQPVVPASKVMPYFIKFRCRHLLEELNSFI